MPRPRTSIAALMTVVAVVALNGGVARLLIGLEDGDYWLVASAPIACTLQFGIVRLIRRRGLARAFWGGFVSAGSAALASLLWALAFEGSALNGVWTRYVRAFEGLLMKYLSSQSFGVRAEVAEVVCAGLILFAPQFLIALAGGLLARGIARWRLGPMPAAPAMTTEGPRPTGDLRGPGTRLTATGP
jgi:hypothetical protein